MFLSSLTSWNLKNQKKRMTLVDFSQKKPVVWLSVHPVNLLNISVFFVIYLSFSKTNDSLARRNKACLPRVPNMYMWMMSRHLIITWC